MSGLGCVPKECQRRPGERLVLGSVRRWKGVMGIQGKGPDGKGRRRPDNKGDGIAARPEPGKRNGRDLFFLPCPCTPGLVMASSPLPGTVPSRNVLYPWPGSVTALGGMGTCRLSETRSANSLLFWQHLLGASISGPSGRLGGFARICSWACACVSHNGAAQLLGQR